MDYNDLTEGASLEVQQHYRIQELEKRISKLQCAISAAHGLLAPSRFQRICEPCEFHHCIGALCGPAGGTSWRMYVCKHPDAFGPMPDGLAPEKITKLQELRARILESGRTIGKTENQPDWCPLRQAALKETP